MAWSRRLMLGQMMFMKKLRVYLWGRCLIYLGVISWCWCRMILAQTLLPSSNIAIIVANDHRQFCYGLLIAFLMWSLWNGASSSWHGVIRQEFREYKLYHGCCFGDSFNSVALVRYYNNLKSKTLKLIMPNVSLGSRCEIDLGMIPQSPTNDVNVGFRWWLACHKATSHCLRRCWTRSMSPYGRARPQWVNVLVGFYLVEPRYTSCSISI